jgi:hypothetical protein
VYKISEVSFDSRDLVAGAFVNVTLSFPRYLKSGNYPLQVLLSDFATNELTMNLESFYSIQVVSAVEDLVPPVILNFTALSSLEVAATSSGATTVDFQVVAQDDLSGLEYANVLLSGTNGNDDYYASTPILFDTPVSGQPVTFNVTVVFDASFAKGSYLIAIEVVDATKLSFNMNSGDLFNRGFPATVWLK